MNTDFLDIVKEIEAIRFVRLKSVHSHGSWTCINVGQKSWKSVVEKFTDRKQTEAQYRNFITMFPVLGLCHKKTITKFDHIFISHKSNQVLIVKQLY